jgi:hypothetical protein
MTKPPIITLSPVRTSARVEPFASRGVAVALYVKSAGALVPPGVATTTFTVPATPAGVTQVRLVALDTVTAVQALPPTVTVVLPATKPVPVSVISVPPEGEPADGLTEASVGPDAYVKARGLLVPPGVVTLTVATPAAPAGVTHVRLVALDTVTAVQALPPTVTVVLPATKPVPVSVIVVPPAGKPADGLTEASVGPVA